MFDGVPLGSGIRFHLAATHEERVAVIEELMDECYARLVETRRQSSSMSEDALTVQIVSMLYMVGIPAAHDIESGGHCDILIQAKNRFKWIGEAKLYTGYAKLFDGFSQLSTRYGVAQEGSDHGEIIIYHTKKNAGQALVNWKQQLVDSGLASLSDGHDFSQTSKLSFRTEHNCHSTGCVFYVRHRIVPLFFEPAK
jgi:hypothetical protein